MLRLALLLAVALAVSPARAEVLGGGLADADCRLAFDGVTATAGASGVVCADGDPGCDADGAADGACRFAVRLCTGVAMPGCEPVTLSDVAVAGLPLAAPPLPSIPGGCGMAQEVVVPVGTAAGATVLARGGGELRDVDYMNLCCRRRAGDGIEAARCALGVDPAVSGCAVPRRAARAFATAARLVAADGPAPRALRRARRKLDVVRGVARRIADSDACGNALGLVARHAAAVLAATPSREGAKRGRLQPANEWR